MKKLKSYKLFLEDSFQVQDTDPEDVKDAKEEMNKSEQQMKDYQAKKTQIDQAYASAKTIEEVADKIKQIVGEGDDKNPYLVEYSTIARMQRQISLLNDENMNDKLKVDDFKSELSTIDDSTTKSATQAKITDISNRISDRNSQILDISKNFTELEKQFKGKMKDLGKNMKQYIQNISKNLNLKEK